MRRTVRFLVLLVTIAAVWAAIACEAMTKKGEKCRRAPMPGSQFCWQHGGRQANTNAVSATNAPVREVADDNAARGQCDAMTKKGTRCSRKALPGGTKCWQHQ